MHELCNLFIDLGAQPPSNAYLTNTMLNQNELYLPLKLYVCDKCFLVQTQDFTDRETFFNSEYAYFSSTSTTWLQHAKEFTNTVIDRFSLNEESFVVEVASNDGYLLQNFLENNIPSLGIEPTASTANVAKERGIDTIEDFFGYDLSKKVISDYKKADFLIEQTSEGVTKLTWGMDGVNKGIVEKFFYAVMDFDSMIGKDYETGLADIKALAEQP